MRALSEFSQYGLAPAAKEVGRHCGLSDATVHSYYRELEAKGLARRVHGSWCLTEAGREYLQEAT